MCWPVLSSLDCKVVKELMLHHLSVCSSVVDILNTCFAHVLWLVGSLFLNWGLKPKAIAVKAPSPNHWNVRKLPAAAAAKSLQSCPTLCDPIDGSHQAPPSLGFSRQEHWSGLPFPSPMHESEKWKWSRSVVSASSQPHGLQPTRLLHPWDFPGKSTGVGCHCVLPRVPRTPQWRISSSREAVPSLGEWP